MDLLSDDEDDRRDAHNLPKETDKVLDDLAQEELLKQVTQTLEKLSVFLDSI